MNQINTTYNVIFFDGVCGLCNGFIDFVMKIDTRKRFHFSPLQSEFAKKTLPPELISDLKTVVVQIEGHTYKKAPAVIRVMQEIGGSWSLLGALKVLPEPLLNLGYDIVASNRYKLFGKKETCRLPTPEERSRFIL